MMNDVVASQPAALTPPPERYSKDRTLPRLVWPLLALALLLLWNLAFTPGFYKIRLLDGHLYGTLIDIVDNAAPVMLVAFGMTLVIATGGVDLSVGAVMAIAGAAAAILLRDANWGLAPTLAAALGISLLAGLWNGLLVAVFDIQPIVATLILMVAGRGVAQLLTGGQIPELQHYPGLVFLGSGFMLALPFSLTLVLGVALMTAALTRATALGLFVEATGDNPRAARYAGVNTRAVKFLAYAWTGLCAGLAGLVAVADIKAADANQVGLNIELDAILAVVIGGTALTGGRFSLVGSFVGALIIQTLKTTILAMSIPDEYNLVVKALVVLVVCLLQSDMLRAQLVRIYRAIVPRRH
jgi:simple sugar transport system permease protein